MRSVRRSTLIFGGIAVVLAGALLGGYLIDRSSIQANQPVPQPVAEDDSADFTAEVERVATVPATSTEVCTTPSEGNDTPFERASLSKNGDDVQVRFEFGEGSLFPEPQRNNVGYPRLNRIVVALDDIYAYFYLDLSDDGRTIKYAVRDRPNGERIPGELVYVNGDIVVSLPRPAELVSSEVRWRVEAQGIDCPLTDDYESGFLMTDIFGER